jgi:hypothetical protein
MACPTCNGSLKMIPATYPTFHCRMCGTLVESSEEGTTPRVPTVISAIKDARGECLREDRSRCVVYDTATKVKERRYES